MRQSAIVKRNLENNMAEVLVTRGSACGGNCKSCGGCHHESTLTVTCSNPIGAAPGERVTIESKTTRILGVAALVYLVPIVGFLVFYAIGNYTIGTENGTVLMSLIGFFLGVAVVVAVHKLTGSRRISFRIICRE